MYKRSGAKVSEVKASHLVYISHPDAVARCDRDSRARGTRFCFDAIRYKWYNVIG